MGLAFDGVGKKFADVDVLRGLDLDVPDGELVVVLGPSGSGKTTLLRIAAGLDRPAFGVVRLGSRNVTDDPPSRRDVSMMFEGAALFPHLDVAANIGFGLSIRRLPRTEVRRRVEQAAETVGCSHLLERRPWQLSGGERQRVSLARSLVREPEVFLLDEPFSNLDAVLRNELRVELRALQQRVGATMLLVTHDQADAMTIADRVAVLHDGVIQQIDAPGVVYERPENRFVATFVGTPPMNVFGAAVEGDSIVAGPFRIPRARFPLPAPAHPLSIGVRPEHIRLAGDAGIPATVRTVETTGREFFLHLETSGGPLVALAPPGRELSTGSMTGIQPIPESAYLFESPSGATLGRYP